MRLATSADLAAVDTFLLAHAPVAMFPLTNLRKHGITGGHPHAMTFWINDPLTDVLGLTEVGMIQPVFTSDAPHGIANALRRRQVTGVVGAQSAVGSVKAAINLPRAALDRIEPHYELALSNLRMPDVDGFTLESYAMAPRELLIQWRTDYEVEALDADPADAAVRGIAHVDSALETGDHRVLMKDGVPLSITGINAKLPRIVMIGGVYTPPGLRGAGYASKALALNLSAARDRGVQRAVLSAANMAAAKAYERIGFQQMGTFEITILSEPVTLDG